MLAVVYEHPKMDFDSVLRVIKFKKQDKKDILKNIPFLKNKYDEIGKSKEEEKKKNWIMGELRPIALGNVPMNQLKKEI